MALKTDLTNPRNFSRSDYELEEFLLLCIFVAGKGSKVQSGKLEMLIEELGCKDSIFSVLCEMSIGEIEKVLVKVKAGQYSRLSKCLYELSRKGLCLRTCTCEELESISGIGMKTSRFFVTYSRPNTNYAILDTHILAWLREIFPDAPKSTPTKSAYLVWEKRFLVLCETHKTTPHELDLKIWLERQKSYNV